MIKAGFEVTNVKTRRKKAMDGIKQGSKIYERCNTPFIGGDKFRKDEIMLWRNSIN